MSDTEPSSPPTDAATIAFHKILEDERAKAYRAGYAFGVREGAERADQWVSSGFDTASGTDAAQWVLKLLTEDRQDYIDRNCKEAHNDLA